MEGPRESVAPLSVIASAAQDMDLRTQAILASGLAALLLLTFGLYRIGLDGPFLLDDSANIDQAQVDTLDWHDWVAAIFSNDSGRLGRRVAAATFAATSFFHGLDPWAFKYQNLMLHLLCGTLLMLLGARLLAQLPRPPSPGRIWLVAILAGALWLLHPLLVSTTLYAVQRMTQLSLLFVLLALLTYVHARTRLDIRPLRTTLYGLTGIGLLGLLGLFSKEDAALLPVYLLVIETVIFHWRSSSTRARRALWALQGPLVIAPLALAAIFVAVKFDALTAGYVNRPFTLHERLMTESQVLWLYLKTIFLPNLGDMTLFHDGHPIQRSLDWTTVAAIAGHIALIVLALTSRRTAPVIALGILIFYSAHLLESTFLPLELVFEHRNYFAAWGPLLALCYYALYPSPKLSDTRVARPVAMAGLLLLCAFMTHARALTWSNGELLYLITLSDHPNSQRALSNLANIRFQQGRLAEARYLLKRNLELSDSEAAPAMHLLVTYCGGTSSPSDLLERSRRLLKTGRITAYTRNGVDSLLSRKSRGKCPALSNSQFIGLTRAFLGNPRNRGEVRYYSLVHHGRALMLDKRFDEAIESFVTANEMRDQAPFRHKSYALEGLVTAHIKSGNLTEAKQAIIRLQQLTEDPRIAPSPSFRSLLGPIRDANLENLQLKQSRAKPGGNGPQPATEDARRGMETSPQTQ